MNVQLSVGIGGNRDSFKGTSKHQKSEAIQRHPKGIFRYLHEGVRKHTCTVNF